MRFEHIRYAKFGKTVLGFIPISGRKTIMILEDAIEMIDPGFYHLVEHKGDKFKDTFALIGAEVSHMIELGVEKSTCVYHAGDTHEDTTGCPLVGVRFHFSGSTPDVDGGAEAMTIIRQVLKNQGPNYVNITERIWQ